MLPAGPQHQHQQETRQLAVAQPLDLGAALPPTCMCCPADPAAAAARVSTERAAEAGPGDAAEATAGAAGIEAMAGHAPADARDQAGPVRLAAAHRIFQRQPAGDIGAAVGGTGGDGGAAVGTAAAGQKVGRCRCSSGCWGFEGTTVAATTARAPAHGEYYCCWQQQQGDQEAPGAVGTRIQYQADSAVGGVPDAGAQW